MKSGKTEQFFRLLQTVPASATSRGRKPRPFSPDSQGNTSYPLSSKAYAERLHHFKILVAVDHDCPCLDPVQEVKHRIGSVRRTLWMFLYFCLPDFPDKNRLLRDLQDTYESNLLIRGIQKIVLRELESGRIHDDQYASVILNDKLLDTFATHWFTREKTNKAKND